MAFDGALSIANSIEFLGFNFNPLDLDLATDAVAARASLGLPFGYVVTPNVDHVVSLSKDDARRRLYDRAWLTLNDSKVLRGLARRAGIALPTATGADLTERLLDTVIDRHEPVAIIGGDADGIDELTRRYGLTNVRWHNPPMGLKHKPEAIVEAAAFAAAQNARFTFICVGAPQQELIAYAIAQRGDASGVGLCCGAALEFISGRMPRAPKWMRKAGLEWAHRLAREPARLWRRYLIDGPKVFSLFASWRTVAA